MIIPVVTADVDPDALEDLIALCVRYHASAPKPPAPPGHPRTPADPADTPEAARRSGVARRSRPG